jgi:hypothetical protein
MSVSNRRFIDRPTRREQGLKATIFLILNVVAGIGLPFGISLYDPTALTLLDGVIVGLLTVVGLTLFELVYAVFSLVALRTQEYKLWVSRTNVDTTLTSIRSGLHTIILDDELRDSFFLDHYTRELELVDSRIQTTITRKEMLLDRFHIDSTEVLLALFDDRSHNQFLATHVLADVTDSFDVTYQMYFFAWLEKLETKKVKSLKRLFILEDETELERENVKRLLAFHNNDIPGLEAKVVKRSELIRVKSDYLIDDGVTDIGIFSNQYVYLGSTRQDDQISGHFTRDKKTIHKYTACFNTVWDSASAQPVSDYVTKKVPAAEIFQNRKLLEPPKT